MNASEIAYHLFRLENWATREQRHEALVALMGLSQSTEINRHSAPLDKYMDEFGDYSMGLIGEDYMVSPYGNKLVVISSGGAYDINVYQIIVYSHLNPDSYLVVEKEMNPMELYKYMMENES